MGLLENDSPAPENSILPEALITAENNERILMLSNSDSSSSNPSAKKDLINSNQDVLTQIFLKLPIISLIRLKTVSPPWKTLIESNEFSYLRSPRIECPSGMFFEGWNKRYDYHYVLLGLGNTVRTAPFKKLDFDSGLIKIMQSCHGLLLCADNFKNWFVYNPTTKKNVSLPQMKEFNPDDEQSMILAFNPTNSCEYKVISHQKYTLMKIRIFSSKTRSWKRSREKMDMVEVDKGIYSHNSINWWVTFPYPSRLVHFDLETESLRYVDIITEDTTDYGQILAEYMQESEDGMYLVLHECRNSHNLNIYEINKGYSEWPIKYKINLVKVIRVHPDMLTAEGMHFVVHFVVLGGEEGSLVVLEVPKALLQ